MITFPIINWKKIIILVFVTMLGKIYPRKIKVSWNEITSIILMVLFAREEGENVHSHEISKNIYFKKYI